MSLLAPFVASSCVENTGRNLGFVLISDVINLLTKLLLAFVFSLKQ